MRGAVVGADGLWSAVRESLLADGPPRPSDHVAYRGLIPLPGVDGPWAHEVTAWLGPRLHAVSYPVRGGRALNVVCVVQQPVQGADVSLRGWDVSQTAQRLAAATVAMAGVTASPSVSAGATNRRLLGDHMAGRSAPPWLVL